MSRSIDATAALVTDTGWIVSAGYDAVFFFGAGLIATAVGVLVLLSPSLLVPLLWLWMLVLEGPHLLATFQRTYLDATSRQQQGALLMGSLAWFAVPFALVGAYEVTGQALFLDVLLLAAALWSYHHGVRQHYGLMAIYEAKAGAPPRLWRFDQVLLTGLLWLMLGWSVVALDANRTLYGFSADLAPTLHTLSAALGLVVLAGIVGFAGSMLYRRRRALSLKPVAFALVGVLAVSVFSATAVGLREPLYPAAPGASPEQLLLGVTLVGGIVHGVQYLGITFATTRRRYDVGDRTLAARLARAPLLTWALMIVVSVGYVLLDAGRAAHPGIDLVAPDSTTARLCLAGYWGLFFHHYYLDQRIWRVRGDVRLRQELGL